MVTEEDVWRTAFIIAEQYGPEGVAFAQRLRAIRFIMRVTIAIPPYQQQVLQLIPLQGLMDLRRIC